jgi:leucyl-tRNA synthetase
VPLYLAEYVLPDVGTGAVMGVPAHDDRDAVFAAHHDLPSLPVVVPANPMNADEKDETEKDENENDGDMQDHIATMPRLHPHHQHRLIHSGHFTGLSAPAAAAAITTTLEDKQSGHAVVQYRLRDWLVSRQRYWGAPVPVIHCPTCGPVGVPKADLPVTLPPLTDPAVDLKQHDGGTPFDASTSRPSTSWMKMRMEEWKACTCPSCGGAAERDSDTLDTFVDSSWYFLRFTDSGNAMAPFTKANVAKWMGVSGVDLYIGGIEHAILHLLYARFVAKFLHDHYDDAVPREPFKKLLAQGMVLGRTYTSPSTGRVLKPSDIAVIDGIARDTATMEAVVTSWEKMSKSKHNGVNPEDICRKYGADVARLLVLFKAPPSHELEWDDADLHGQSRWLMRIWGLLDNHMMSSINDNENYDDLSHGSATATTSGIIEDDSQEVTLATHRTIMKVTQALHETQSFNVAIAELMKFSNFLASANPGSAAFATALDTLITMLAPLAPHNASEMFATLNGGAVDVHERPWPMYDPAVLASAQVKMVIQIRGKTRETVLVPADADEAALRALAMEQPAVRKHLGRNPTIRKVIYVPSKKQGQHAVLNFVV